MKVAVIGQSLFGAEVYRLLQKDGHHIVGVFTVPDVNGKPDPLGKDPLHDTVSSFFLFFQSIGQNCHHALSIMLLFCHHAFLHVSCLNIIVHVYHVENIIVHV